MNSIIKKPSAYLPIVFSVAISIMIVSFITLVGVEQNEDEGMAAHLFQLWLAYEVVAIGFFAAKWLAKDPKSVLYILAVQVMAVILAAAPIFILGL